ncbi:ubiquinol-cytochrome-c reductase complex assembly factor 1 [Toxorhynchites rutilus septentrionalis]|uniref:ubiquinol-cytochrome-c reductase complex assembly factor 1 n=1 Tax=Toxorhynchites rutilus septentrionalis TaxID=329112 RepID=UPI002478E0FA|nr:ubiquinol-cytochrome-c reductase complex assembly factor 1 [Toxorhynchites rutilus septentrionalis]
MLSSVSRRALGLSVEVTSVLLNNTSRLTYTSIDEARNKTPLAICIPSIVSLVHYSNNAHNSLPTAGETAATTIAEAAKGGFLKRFINKMGWLDNTRSRLRVSGCLLYESVVDNINYTEFFLHFKMPDTYNTWFLITELHVWMLMVRAMAEGAEKAAAGRFLRNCIVETMWNDVTTRAKKLSAHNPSVVRPQVQMLSEQFQAALLSYDEGISFDDKALAAALWRRFFCCKCDDYEKLELLVQYVRKQMAMLDATSRYDFAIKPKVKWLPLLEKPTP